MHRISRWFSLLLIFTLLGASPALASRPITLGARGPAPEQANGIIRFKTISSPADSVYRIKLIGKVRSLPQTAGNLYTMWFIDKESGQSYRLATFNTDKHGDADFTEVLQISTLDYFESLIVTVEPRNELDPTPSDTVVLEGITTEQPRTSD